MRLQKLTEQQLRHLHSLGYLDKQIATLSDLHVKVVARKRCQLGLKPNKLIKEKTVPCRHCRSCVRNLVKCCKCKRDVKSRRYL